MLKYLKVFPLQIIISNRLLGHCSSWPVAAFNCVGLLSHITGQGMSTVLACFCESSTNLWLWWNLHPVRCLHGLMLMLSAGFLKYLTENVPSSVSVAIYHTSQAPKYKELLECHLSKGTVRGHACTALGKNSHWDLGMCKGSLFPLMETPSRGLPTHPVPAMSPQLQWLLSQSF